MIQIKRAYEPTEQADGLRILVDRIWPRGLSKETLHLDNWAKEISPSDDLRKWFAHKPQRWAEFIKRYEQELETKRDDWEWIVKASRRRRITLIFSAKDVAHNNALVLKNYLDRKLAEYTKSK